jgi:hypothetical protein
VRPSEEAAMRAAAEKAGQTLAEWMRDVLVKATKLKRRLGDRDSTKE